MKKIITALALLIPSILMKAQQTASFGIHGGLNRNSASGSALSDDYKKSLNGINIGLHLTAPVSKQFSIRTLLQYEQNGWAYRSLLIEATPGYITNADIRVKMDYISMYILPEFSFGKKLVFSLNAGPYLGILADNQLRTEFPDSSGWNKTIVIRSKSDDRNPINFGIAAGAGVQTALTKNITIRLDARNNFGLSNVLKSSSTKARLNTLAFSMGLSYRLKRSPFKKFSSQ